MKVKFLDSGIIIDELNLKTLNELEEEIDFEVKTTDTIKKLFFQSTEINYLEQQISSCLNFHFTHKNFPKHSPDNIDIVFTEKNIFSHLIGKIIGRQKAAHVDVEQGNYNPNCQTISLSTDLTNFTQHSHTNMHSDIAYQQYNDYTNKLKIQILKNDGEIIDIAKTHYVQTIFLHELAHTILNKAFRGTIFLEHFKKDILSHDPIAQFATNVAEGFCDGFAGLLMTKQLMISF